MLKFTYLFNFGLVGALVAPAAFQRTGSVEHLERSIRATDQALATLRGVEAQLAAGDYKGVEAILGATEAPFGGIRERSQLLDTLRRDIGELGHKAESIEVPVGLEHLRQDPTAGMRVVEGEAMRSSDVATTGLTAEERSDVGNIWPPVLDSDLPVERKSGEYSTFEAEGFTVDAVLQGRAYYRAKRYKEALRLFSAQEGEPLADYWMGRCFERLDRPSEAVAAYTRVVANEKSGALGERAAIDQEFLRWSIDFERRVKDHRESGAQKR